ncbi:MAG: PHP domain-containing protein [Clostridia bacterium]|nr:PHP domain-containing protein [Clostridia bacterium]
MKYVYETHLHTDESSACGKTPAREYIPFYIDRGYDGIVVTDHFTGNTSYVPNRSAPWKDQVDAYCRGWEEAKDEGERRGFKVFFGIEQQFANDECLVYGPDKNWLLAHPDIPDWGRRKWLDEVEKIGGCVVLAHPFRVRDYVRKITLHPCVHAVEAFNAGNRPVDDVYALAYARHFGYPITAGSDMHFARPDSELYGVEFDEPWEDLGAYIRAIREGLPFGLKAAPGRGQGEPLPLERPYEMLNREEQPVPWNVSELLPSGSEQNK